MKYKVFALFSLLALNVAASPQEVTVEAELLEEKSELCLLSMSESKCSSTAHCGDMVGFANHVFKGSTSTWIAYNTQKKNINQSNFDLVSRALDAHIKALKRQQELPECE